MDVLLIYITIKDPEGRQTQNMDDMDISSFIIHEPLDDTFEKGKKKEAMLVIKSLKARFPLSDKFLHALFKTMRLGVDFSTK